MASGTPIVPTVAIPQIKIPALNNIPGFAGIPASIPGLAGLGNLGNINSLMSGLPANVNQSLSCVIPAVINGAIPNGVTLPNAPGALGALTVLQSATMGKYSGVMSMANLLMMASGVPNISQILMLAKISIGVGSCLNQIVPISIPGITAQMPGQLSTGINVSQILGMQGITNPSALIAMIPQYSQALGTLNQNPNTQALLSLVLMGVAQQYQTIQFP
jgi:hypothetical protein